MKRFNAIIASTFALLFILPGCEVSVTARATEQSTWLETGTLVVTNDLDWSSVRPDIRSAEIIGDDFVATLDEPGNAQGFSLSEVPTGDYLIAITDIYEVEYLLEGVRIEADAENIVSLQIDYALSGAINLTNRIDNLDGLNVYVVGMYATPPNGDEIDLASEYNWLAGTQVEREQEAVAIGVPEGNYQLILADLDDNYYLVEDVRVQAGQVTDVEVTQEDRDVTLTLALN